MLEHGGGLRAAAQRYGIALDQWLDLSTGLNPQGWPVPPIPAPVWRCLPEPADGLEQAAAAYYDTDQLLAVAGSQAAIQALPALYPTGRVGVLTPSYAEHAHAWQQAGHHLEQLPAESLDAALRRSTAPLDGLVLVQPNNPTGIRFPRAQIMDWHAALSARGGWLVVDEAFMDTTPEHSLSTHAGLPGLVVLRSLGKFFGLAGVRVGFVLAAAALRERLQEKLGPWSVNHPGRWVAARALDDSDWQRQTRQQLASASRRLADLLQRQGLAVGGGTALFQWVPQPEAAFWHDALARRGILVRRFADPPGLRFGLPGAESDWRRLEWALAGVRAERLC